MKKQTQIFLSLDDEIRWSQILKISTPTIKFLNDNVWSGVPDERCGIHDCPSGRVYLFEGDLKTLPILIRKTGEIEGPISGCVVQVLRPTLVSGILLSGRVAVGFDSNDDRMKLFVGKIWQSLKELGKTGVLRPDYQIDKNYLVGLDLMSKLNTGTAMIADRATKMPYQLPESV